MIRTRSLLRLAPLVAAVVPFATMFGTACGGSDVLFDDGGSADSMAPDGETADGASQDGTVADAGSDVTTPTDATTGSEDASDAAKLDGTVADGDLADGSDGATHDGAIEDGAVHDGAVHDAGSDAEDAGDANVADAQGDASVEPGILGSSAQFAVFSGATVVNATATATTITGDLGTYPSTTAIGLTPPVVVGAEHLGDLVAKAAATDIQIAYNRLIPGNLPCGTVMTGLDLGGKTLVPGVYCFSSTAGLTGTLTLDAQNNAGATWVFQIGSALTTASGSSVVVINGTAGQVCNAYWQVTSAATLGTHSVFGGNILALAAVTITTGTTVLGRTFGVTAEVSTDTNILSIATCAAVVPIADAGLPDAADAGDSGDAGED